MNRTDGTTEPAIGWYVVLDGSPFFSVTDSTGSYLLTNLPQGNYTITPKSLMNKVYGRNESITHVEISGDTVSIQNLTVINPNEL